MPAPLPRFAQLSPPPPTPPPSPPRPPPSPPPPPHKRKHYVRESELPYSLTMRVLPLRLSRSTTESELPYSLTKIVLPRRLVRSTTESELPYSLPNIVLPRRLGRSTTESELPYSLTNIVLPRRLGRSTTEGELFYHWGWIVMAGLSVLPLRLDRFTTYTGWFMTKLGGFTAEAGWFCTAKVSPNLCIWVVFLLRQNGSPSEGSPTEAGWFDQRLLVGKRANWGRGEEASWRKLWPFQKKRKWG
jgi:hypothetical protein